MEGNVRKRGDKWYYSFETARIDGKRNRIERVGGNTKEEALRSLRDAIADYENGGLQVQLNNMSVSDYLDFWFDNYVMKNLKYNTQENYRGIIKSHIKPYIGKYKLKSIGPAQLQDLLNKEFDKGFSKKTLSIVTTVLKNALKRAVYPYQLIKDNPMSYVSMPKYDIREKSTREDLKIITLDQYFKILDFCPIGNSFHLPLVIGFNTGMRRGEVSGLTWDCIDFASNTIEIKQIMINGKDGYQIGTPKTQSSYRKILVGQTLIEELKAHKKMQSENRLYYGEYYHESNFVCTKENGEPVTPNSIKWSCNNIQKKLGIKFNFHSLRHTHATMLLESGAKIKDIQERLGHSRIATTMDTYSHVTQTMKTETVDLLEEKLKRHKN